jgi:hypothetical protein
MTRTPPRFREKNRGFLRNLPQPVAFESEESSLPAVRTILRAPGSLFSQPRGVLVAKSPHATCALPGSPSSSTTNSGSIRYGMLALSTSEQVSVRLRKTEKMGHGKDRGARGDEAENRREIRRSDEDVAGARERRESFRGEEDPRHLHS